MNYPKKMRQGVTVLFIAEVLILLASAALIVFTIMNMVYDNYDLFSSESFVGKVQSLLGLFYFCFVLFRFTPLYWLGVAIAIGVLTLLMIGCTMASKGESKFRTARSACVMCFAFFLVGELMKYYPRDPDYVYVVRLFITLLRDVAAVDCLLCISLSILTLGEKQGSQAFIEKAQRGYRTLFCTVFFTVAASDIVTGVVAGVFPRFDLIQFFALVLKIAALTMGVLGIIKSLPSLVGIMRSANRTQTAAEEKKQEMESEKREVRSEN